MSFFSDLKVALSPPYGIPLESRKSIVGRGLAPAIDWYCFPAGASPRPTSFKRFFEEKATFIINS